MYTGAVLAMHSASNPYNWVFFFRSLSWITPKILQFSLCEQDEEVSDQIASAVTGQ